MSYEFPEIPKPYYAGREYDFDRPEPGVDTNGGPFVLVNVEELEREIDAVYSRKIEKLIDRQAELQKRDNPSDWDIAHIDGKIEGYKELHEKTLELLRRAAGVQR